MQLCTAADPPYEEIVTLASRAPSVNNTQPWLWRVADSGVELFADWSRQLVHGDPEGRELLISCGAVLHHFRVASRGLGWRAEVSYHRETGRPAALATLSLARAPVTAEAVRGLRALLERQTDRRAFAPLPVPAGTLLGLLERVRARGVEVTVVRDPETRSLVLTNMRRADRHRWRDVDYRNELLAWTRRTRGDGVPASNIPARVVGRAGSEVPQRFPAGTLVDTRRGSSAGELLVLSTDGDGQQARMRVGEALSEMWLGASAGGLALVPHSHAVELAGVRALIRSAHPGGEGFPQMMVRLGRSAQGAAGTLPRTRRRSVDEVLVR